MRSVAFVSGKGGVGKTSLATNFAYAVSLADVRVLLVDMDFDNMGCTGVFAANYPLGNFTSKQALMTDDWQSKDCHLTQVIENKLWFLPASLFAESTHARDSSLVDPSLMLGALRRFLDAMEAHYQIDCVIFDCHGGIDAASIACAGVCDYTLIITEPDSVTFAGTLGIFDAYSEYYKNQSSISPNVRYVVNRISPRLAWQYLNSIYSDYIERHLGTYSSNKNVLAYIPNESLVADTFGSYPFQAKLAPASLYARKIRLMVFQLFSADARNLVASPLLEEFKSSSKVENIYKRIMTTEARSVVIVMRAFGLLPIFTALFTLTFMLAAALGNIQLLKSHTELIALPILVYLLYSSYGLWHCTAYMHEKLIVQKGLLRHCTKINSKAARLTLVKLHIFRISTFIGMLMMLSYAFLLLYAGYQAATDTLFALD